jgi:hypothetical protein
MRPTWELSLPVRVNKTKGKPMRTRLDSKGKNCKVKRTQNRHCWKTDTARTVVTRLVIFMLSSPHHCARIDFTRSRVGLWKCVTAPGFIDDFLFVSSLVFDSFFQTGKLLKVLKELLVDSTVAWDIVLFQQLKVGLIQDMLVYFLLKGRELTKNDTLILFREFVLEDDLFLTNKINFVQSR